MSNALRVVAVMALVAALSMPLASADGSSQNEEGSAASSAIAVSATWDVCLADHDVSGLTSVGACVNDVGWVSFGYEYDHRWSGTLSGSFRFTGALLHAECGFVIDLYTGLESTWGTMRLAENSLVGAVAAAPCDAVLVDVSVLVPVSPWTWCSATIETSGRNAEGTGLSLRGGASGVCGYSN